MNTKTKRFFSLSLIVAMQVSVLSVVPPVMALDKCNLSISTRLSQSSYGIYDTIEYEVTLCNNEGGTVDYDMTIKLLDPDGDPIDSHSHDRTIPPGACDKYPHSKSPPSGGWEPGMYTLRVIVTATGPYCYYNEVKDRTFPVVDEPDLRITDVWDDNSTICYKIKNVGTKKAGASNTNLTIDGVFKASDSVASLEPGEERTESFDYTWTCTDKSDKIKVCADYTDDVAELNEGNNRRTETWSCLPDLVITDIWNDNSTIYYKIKNKEDKKAGASNTNLTIDGVFKASDSVASLEPGEERTESFIYTWNCMDKSDEIKVCADYMDDVAETDEENNCLKDTWTCPPPDIWVSPTSFDVRLPPDVVSNYTLTIGNNGTGVLKFNVRDIETQVARATVTSLGTAFNNGTHFTDVVSREHETAFGDIEDSLNFSIASGIDISSTPSQPGWPITTGGWVRSSPALGDIDGDGNIEVIVGSYDNKVYAWHHDGSTVTGWPITTGGGVWSSPAVGDIDGDGDIEVVVGSADEKVYAWHHDGSTVIGWPKTTGARVLSSPALSDIDGDGDIEVVIGSYDDKVYAWHHDGSPVTGWPTTMGEGVRSSPALGDIDGDGDIEVVVGSFDDKVYAWHHDGSPVTGWPKTTGDGVLSSPALGDIDGDGDIEVVIGSHDDKVYAWHHDGSSVTGWPITTGDDVISPALGDIDGDGDIEVVVGSRDDKVYAWHHDGSSVTGWPKTTGGWVLLSSPALGDINGDGDIEVVIGSWDDKVYAWHHNGSTVTGWPITTGGVVDSSPALGDIDGDGDIEVVVGSDDEKVYAWDCSGTYNQSNIEWGTFHHDVRRTGLYGYPEEATWLSEYPTSGIVDPANQTDITATFNTSGLDFGEYNANIAITSNDPDEYPVIIPVRLTVYEPGHFDTGLPENPYPSIGGTHTGTITPFYNINVSTFYTYSCAGTGGHTESIELEENGIPIASGTWNGYQGDYHNIAIHNVSGVPYLMLYKGHKYNYTIVTGSYPQIIHAKSKDVTGGIITCTSFVDANGKTYTDWIPAIRLE